MHDAITRLGAARGRGQHPGLLLQRYLFHAAVGTERWAAEKRDLLRTARDAANDDELRRLYRAAFDRWTRTLPTDPPPIDLITEGRLIVGLGSESVLETGIRLHHTYGLPVIPGSALKGVSAHYCNAVWGSVEPKFVRETGEYHRLLFGTTDDSGCITFHDAWLVPGSQNPLVLDVMTPHHPDWLDGNKPPTDFDSPVPVSFVSVAGTFRVAVSWNGPAGHAQSKNWTQLALELLKEALREWGVGGKTSSGYGRLMEPKQTAKAGAGTTTSATTPRAPATPVKRNSGTPAKVRIVGVRPKGGFDVQETGRPQGTLTLGTPLSGTVTGIGAEVDVLVHVDDPSRPQYKWPTVSKK
jgi:CRISPR type III-B/RAMP module RAMP protein Cmr6